tara:strand:+ start:142 stop:324 length:183 start_codon:yes stop_codon:yes gene_type:complete
MEDFDEVEMMEFLDWVAQECEIKEGGDPWTGDNWQKWFYYKGDQMVGNELYMKYQEVNAT